MSRGPQTFREADVTCAVRAVQKAGVEVVRVEVDKAGRIIVVAGKPDNHGSTTREQETKEWDRI